MIPVVLEKHPECSFCGEEIKKGDFVITREPEFMCCKCYKGRTIFPLGVVKGIRIELLVDYK